MSKISFSDNNSDRASEDSAPAAAGEGRPQDRSLLRIRRRGSHPTNVCLRSGGPLAGLHLVRHRVCGALGTQRQR